MSKNPDVFETPFDKYKTIRVIGEGGAGRVFLATNDAGEEFAIKCLRPELLTSIRRKRFQNELNFCAKQMHENILRVVSYGVVNWEGSSTPFYVMPKYESTLRDQLNQGLHPKDVLPAFDQLLSGLEAAHLLGVFHRDMKPENILFDKKTNRYVVADFGIAHFEEDLVITDVETKLTEKLANFAYSAPEQRAKGGEVDRRADIYALGLILNEMFTRTIPEGAGHATIASVAADYAYLDPLVEQMRQQNPNVRPASIGEIKSVLLAHKNAFVSRQRLDEKRMMVVSEETPDEVLPVEIAGVSWNGGYLVIQLSRSPAPPWIVKFQQTPTGHYPWGAGPTNWNFTGGSASVRVDESQAQMAIDVFKDWAQQATMRYQRQLKDDVEVAAEQQREKLTREVAEAEESARVTSGLRI